MDIPSLSIMSAQNSLQSSASILVMKKAMDASAENGQAMTDLLATAGPSLSPAHLGQAVDISA